MTVVRWIGPCPVFAMVFPTPALHSLSETQKSGVKRPFRFWKVVAVVVLLWGTIASYVTVVAPLRDRLALRMHLGNFAEEYFQFQSQIRRSPMDLDELLAFVEIDAKVHSGRKRASLDRAIASIRAGDVVVLWNALPGSHYQSSQLFIGYEARTPVHGGFVIRASGNVSKLSAWEFKRLTPVDTLKPPANYPRIGTATASPPPEVNR